MDTEAKEARGRKGRCVTCAGVGLSQGQFIRSFLVRPNTASCINNQCKIIMAADKVIILTGASRGRQNEHTWKEDRS